MQGMPNPSKMMELQAQVRHNSAEIQDFFQDLNKWEDDVKQRDKAILKGELNPTRSSKKQMPEVRKKGFAEMVPSGMPGPKDKERAKGNKGDDEESRIKPKNYQDYNQWDKFVHKDLDKMLDEFDENDRQEQEEEHRNRLAEERRKIEEKERLARVHVDKAEQLKNAGNEKLKGGDLSGARVLYSEAIATDPVNPIPYANRAQVLLKLGELAGAIQDCDAAIERDPRYVKAYMRRAAARTMLGDRGGEGGPNREAAIADLKKVLMLEPGNKQAKSDLAELTKAPPTEEEKAVREREEAAAKARAEREQRKKERGGKRLQVREQEESHTPAADADPSITPRRTKICEVPEGGKGGGGTGTGGVPPQQKEKKVVIDMNDARAIAESAKAAVASKLASEPIQVPANSIEFERAWKRVYRDQDKMLDFLSTIPPERFASLFKSDIDDDVLSGVVKCLDARFLPDKQSEACVLLQSLASVPRISIAIRLMGKAEKSTLESVLGRLEGCEGFRALGEKYRAFLQK